MKPDKRFAPNQDIEIMYRRESSIASIQYVKTNQLRNQVSAKVFTGVPFCDIQADSDNKLTAPYGQTGGIGRCAMATFMIPLAGRLLANIRRRQEKEADSILLLDRLQQVHERKEAGTYDRSSAVSD